MAVTAFKTTSYESDLGIVTKLRMSLDEFAAITESTAPVDSAFHAKASGSRRTYGIHARGVRLVRNVGTEALPNLKYSFLAIPTAAEQTGIADNSVLTIGTTAWTVAGKVPELLV